VHKRYRQTDGRTDGRLHIANVTVVFLTVLSCLFVAKRLDASRCHLVGSSPCPVRHCVRWGPSSLKKGHNSPHFSSHVYCGRMARWIRMPLGMELGLGSGDIVLDGTKPPAPTGHSSPHFPVHVCCGQTAVWIRMPLSTRQASAEAHCIRWTQLPQKRGTVS